MLYNFVSLKIYLKLVYQNAFYCSILKKRVFKIINFFYRDLHKEGSQDSHTPAPYKPCRWPQLESVVSLNFTILLAVQFVRLALIHHDHDKEYIALLKD